MKTYTKIKGLTLLELLIVISIVSILAFVAVPAMDNTVKTNSVRSLQRTYLSAFAFARGEAVARNKIVTICPSENETTCSTNPTAWSAGWLIFEDDGANGNAGNGRFDATDEVLLRANKYTGTNTVSVFNPIDSSSLNSISWNYRGYTETRNDQNQRVEMRAALVVCPGDADEFYARGLMLERTGRVNLTRDTEGDDGIHELRYEPSANVIGNDQDDVGQSITEAVSCG